MMRSILLVDDSPTVLMGLADILRDAGHSVETAASAEAALAMLKRKPPLKLMIADYHMPGRNGVALVRETRRLGPYRLLPILMLTTEAQREIREEAKSAGATGWLVKPVAGETLVSLAERFPS